MMWNPPNPKEFFAQVWLIAKQIPEGQVSTYGQIAAMIPPPEGVTPPEYNRLRARWVGTAMNNTPSDEGIPWQRVINSKGAISLPAGSPGASKQLTLLEAEGVIFNEQEQVDFEQCGWNGPDQAWLREHGFYPPKPLRKSGGNTEQLSLF